MSTAELKELVTSLLLSQKETALQMKETDRLQMETARRMKETDQQLKELGKQIGGLGNKFGAFAEDMGIRSIEKILREKFGMNHSIAPRMRVQLNGVEEEYDVLAYTVEAPPRGMIVEIKSKLREEDILQMKRKMENVFKTMPEHSDKTFQGMIVCVSGTPELKRRVIENGWHLAHIGDDIFELETPPDFVPKTYSADG
jgi:hypothetical protein